MSRPVAADLSFDLGPDAPDATPADGDCLRLLADHVPLTLLVDLTMLRDGAAARPRLLIDLDEEAAETSWVRPVP